MGYKSIKCPSCAAEIQLSEDRETGFCTHCGSKVYFQDETQKVEVNVKGHVSIDGIDKVNALADQLRNISGSAGLGKIDALISKGYDNIELEKLDEAVDCFNSVLELTDKNLKAFFGLAISSETESGDLDFYYKKMNSIYGFSEEEKKLINDCELSWYLVKSAYFADDYERCEYILQRYKYDDSGYAIVGIFDTSTPLVDAIINSNLKYIKLFVENMENKDSNYIFDDSVYSMLSLAIEKSNADVINYFLNLNADPYFVVNGRNGPAFMSAVWSNRPDIVKLLIDKGIKFDKCYFAQWKPLHYAIDKDFKEIVSLIAPTLPAKELYTLFGDNYYKYAMGKGKKEIAQIIKNSRG